MLARLPSPAFTSYSPSRSRWSPLGPWTTEPDASLFPTAALLPGAILRHPTFGHLSGYVAVPRGHLAYGMTIADVMNHDREHPHAEHICTSREVTFAAPGPDPLAASAASPDRAGAEWWWFGFDCMHWCDETPLYAPGNPEGHAVTSGDAEYRTWSEVSAWVEELATRVAGVEARRRS